MSDAPTETQPTPVHNRLRNIRKTKALSAADLAQRVGVSRQTIHAIESGDFVPNTAIALRLARALDVAIEEIFSLAEEQGGKPVMASLLAGTPPLNEGQLVRLCRVRGRTIAAPASADSAYLPVSDGTVKSTAGQRLSIQTATGEPGDGKRLLVAGCDPALSLLNSLLTASGNQIVAVPCSSQSALKWLRQGRVHVAGSHLLDQNTGDYNLPFIRKLFPDTGIRVVTFALWEQGLAVRRGNPKRIRAVADLAQEGVCIANREKGSGSRDFLDRGLKAAGVPVSRIAGYDLLAHGHLAAARAVAAGTVDCCVAPRSAARCFGLDFIPLAVERFDLSFAGDSLETPAATALLELLARAHFRKRLETIAGYDTAHTGEVLL